MPLRDHFHPPLARRSRWEALHNQWPAVIVQQLKKQLPPKYVPEPGVHIGARIEIDVGTFARDNDSPDDDELPGEVGYDNGNGHGEGHGNGHGNDGGGVATAVWAPPVPDLAILTPPPDSDESCVRIYDADSGYTLVAAIEIVSPANKDRMRKRRDFVRRCEALLLAGVAVSVVDLVTARNSNLYAELVAELGERDPGPGAGAPAVYAASCRWLRRTTRGLLQCWAYPLEVGKPLPVLPLWLTERLAIPLDLEASYEKACDDLSIPPFAPELPVPPGG